MQALKTQFRTVSGARVKPFCSSFCNAKRFSQATGANAGCKWTMKRKDGCMIEVVVGDDEAPEPAIRNFNRTIFNVGLMNEMRRRKRVMTKREARDLRLKEKAMRKTLFFEELPTWAEDQGDDNGPSPFQQFFTTDSDSTDIFDPNLNTGDDDVFSQLQGAYDVGNYTNLRQDYTLGGGFSSQGGYMNQGSYGYMQQGGGYSSPPNQGGFTDYSFPPTAGQ